MCVYMYVYIYICLPIFFFPSESGKKRPVKNKVWKDSDSEDELESAPEKRLRLAKEYLSRLEDSGNGECLGWLEGSEV